MAKNKISEWSSVAASNTDVGGINIGEGMLPADVNNAMREMMAQIKDQQAGLDGDNFTVGGNLSVAGTSAFTGNSTFTGSSTFNGALVVNGGISVDEDLSLNNSITLTRTNFAGTGSISGTTLTLSLIHI